MDFKKNFTFNEIYKHQEQDDHSFQLKKQQLARIKEVFLKHDVDKSGTIDVSELTTIFYESGLYYSKSEIEAILEKYDKNGDGVLQFSEFSEIMLWRYDLERENKGLLTAFNEFDIDGDGCISERDLRRAMMKVFQDEGEIPNIREVEVIVEAMMETVQLNEQGLIEYSTFLNLMNA